MIHAQTSLVLTLAVNPQMNCSRLVFTHWKNHPLGQKFKPFVFKTCNLLQFIPEQKVLTVSSMHCWIFANVVILLYTRFVTIEIHFRDELELHWQGDMCFALQRYKIKWWNYSKTKFHCFPITLQNLWNGPHAQQIHWFLTQSCWMNSSISWQGTASTSHCMPVGSLSLVFVVCRFRLWAR